MATKFTRPKPNGLFDMGILQEEACSNPHQSVQALKKSLIKAWDKIPLETVQKAVDDFPKRLSMCIGAKGGYFEKK